MSHRTITWVAPLAFTIISLILWEAVVAVFNIPPFFLPPPTVVGPVYVFAPDSVTVPAVLLVRPLVPPVSPC